MNKNDIIKALEMMNDEQMIINSVKSLGVPEDLIQPCITIYMDTVKTVTEHILSVSEQEAVEAIDTFQRLEHDLRIFGNTTIFNGYGWPVFYFWSVYATLLDLLDI